MLPLDTPLNVICFQKDIFEIKCLYNDEEVIIPVDQLSWKNESCNLKHFEIGNIITVKLTEYVYHKKYYLASRRIMLDDNPYSELHVFPEKSVFQGTVVDKSDSNVIVKLSNGAYGILPPYKNRNQALKKGESVDVIPKYVFLFYHQAQMVLQGRWAIKNSENWPTYVNHDGSFQKALIHFKQNMPLKLGGCINATLVRKEPYALYYRYKSHEILVRILYVTCDWSRSSHFVQIAEIGKSHSIRVYSYDYQDNCYYGSLVDVDHNNPYWELTNDSPSMKYKAVVDQVNVNNMNVRLPNGAYGILKSDEILHKRFAKGDVVEVFIQSLRPLTLGTQKLILSETCVTKDFE